MHTLVSPEPALGILTMHMGILTSVSRSLEPALVSSLLSSLVSSRGPTTTVFFARTFLGARGGAGCGCNTTSFFASFFGVVAGIFRGAGGAWTGILGSCGALPLPSTPCFFAGACFVAPLSVPLACEGDRRRTGVLSLREERDTVTLLIVRVTG